MLSGIKSDSKDSPSAATLVAGEHSTVPTQKALHVHSWTWNRDWNGEFYGTCDCGAVNDEFREAERTI